MIYAPIVIPALNRYEHLRRLLESLSANGWAKYTDVYIALDFPPNEKYMVGYKQVCGFLDSFDGSCFKNFIVVKRDRNYGVGKNDCDLIEKAIIPFYDRWIYSEDDLEFSPNFIEYMDKCLERYADDESVLSICGYSYPVEWNVARGSTAFLTQATYSAWGTGQWRDKNSVVREDITHRHYLLENMNRAYRDGLVDAMIPGRRAEYVSYVTLGAGNREMESLTDMALGPYLMLAGKKVVVPVVSKVRNLGFDGTGANCSSIAAASGKHSMDYDYADQPIDQSESFELVVDEDEAHLVANHEAIGDFLFVPANKRRTEAIGDFLYRTLGFAGCRLGHFAYGIIRSLYRKAKGR